MNISPLITPQTNTAVPEQPAWDDPYATLTQQSELPGHSYHYIERKISSNWITERDIELVKFIFVHRWLVMKQIERLFFPDVERDKSVRNRLNRLVEYGLLRRAQWTSYSQPDKNRPSLYELGDSGSDILKNKFGLIPGQRDPRMAKPATMLYRMKYVITNELYIQLRESFDLIHFEFHPSLKRKEEHVVPTAKFLLRTPKGREMPFYLLCHREEEKWLKTIRFQMRFLKDYIIAEDKSAIIIVLVSSDEKAALANKIAEQEGAASMVWYVTDKDLLDGQINLRQGFFTYTNGEKVFYDLR